MCCIAGDCGRKSRFAKTEDLEVVVIGEYDRWESRRALKMCGYLGNVWSW